MSVSNVFSDAISDIRDYLATDRYKGIEKQVEKVLSVMDAMRLALDVVPGDRREELILYALDDLEVTALRKLLIGAEQHTTRKLFAEIDDVHSFVKQFAQAGTAKMDAEQEAYMWELLCADGWQKSNDGELWIKGQGEYWSWNPTTKTLTLEC